MRSSVSRQGTSPQLASSSPSLARLTTNRHGLVENDRHVRTRRQLEVLLLVRAVERATGKADRTAAARVKDRLADHVADDHPTERGERRMTVVDRLLLLLFGTDRRGNARCRSVRHPQRVEGELKLRLRALCRAPNARDLTDDHRTLKRRVAARIRRHDVHHEPIADVRGARVDRGTQPPRDLRALIERERGRRRYDERRRREYRSERASHKRIAKPHGTLLEHVRNTAFLLEKRNRPTQCSTGCSPIHKRGAASLRDFRNIE